MPNKLEELADTPFPDCGTDCPMLDYFGVCECEAVCPYKFDQDGEPVKVAKKTNAD